MNCLTGLYGFLRPNNFLVEGSFDPDFNLRRVDVFPCSWGMLVTLKVTKTLQFRSKPIEIVLPMLHGHPLCPYDALSSVLAIPGASLDPLFRLSDHCCLSYAVFLKCFRSLLQRFGYNPQNYGGHSFRRDADTWAGSVGLSDYDIKMLGYWSNDCFLRYIDSDRDQRFKAMTSFCSLLPRINNIPLFLVGWGLFLLCHCKRGDLDLWLPS